ncbi:MAG: hypothetical protein HGB26_04345, partial [Desulfobulbaceae bacterium]|nr:hypothetical protein [Desulfobulbaceae bacterium]
MAFDISKFIGRFVEEAREHVNALNKGMMDLENNPDDKEVIHQIFRSAHTIKGSSRMLKLLSISELAHKVEDILGALREGKIELSNELSAIIYKGIDSIAGLIEKTASGDNSPVDQSELLKTLEAASKGQLAEHNNDLSVALSEKALEKVGETDFHDQKKKMPEAQSEAKPVVSPVQAELQPKLPENIKVRETLRVGVDKLSELIRLASEINSRQSRAKQNWHEVSQAAKQLETLAERLSASLPSGSDESKDGYLTILNNISLSLKRIGVAGRHDFELQTLLSKELQERSLQLRMLPLSTLFDTFHRSVREFVVCSGKDVNFNIQGGEI